MKKATSAKSFTWNYTLNEQNNMKTLKYNYATLGLNNYYIVCRVNYSWSIFSRYFLLFKNW